MHKVKNTNMHSPYTPEIQISSLSLYNEPFLSYGPIFRKVHRKTQMTLTCSRSKIPTCTLCTPPPPPRGPSFCPFFRSVMWCSWVTWLFRKSGPNDPKWPWHVQGQKYQHACYEYRRGPNFRPFRIMMSHFWFRGHFLEKCTERPQMTLTCSRSNIPTCMLHTPRPKFTSVSLYNEPFLT